MKINLILLLTSLSCFFAVTFKAQSKSLYFLDKNGVKHEFENRDCYPKQDGKNYCIECYNDDTKSEEVTFEQRYKSISETEFNGVFKTKGRNNKFGLISAKGDTIIDFEYSNFNYPDLSWGNYKNQDEQIIEIITKKGIGLYSLHRGELMPPVYDYYEEDYDFMYSQFGNLIVYDGKKVGYYSLNELRETIPPVYKSIDHSTEYEWSSDSLVVLNKTGKYGILNELGETVLPVIYDKIDYFSIDYYNRANSYTILEITEAKKIGIYEPFENKILVPTKFESIEDYLELENGTLTAFTVNDGKKYGVYDYHGNELLPPLFDEIEIANSDWFDEKDTTIVYALKEGKYFGNVNYSVSNIHPPKYDTLGFDLIVNFYGYRFGKTSETVNLLNGKLELFEGEFIVEGNTFDIFRKGEKFGAKNKDGEVLVAPEYDSASFLNGRDEVMIGYKNGVKYYIYVDNNQVYSEDEW